MSSKIKSRWGKLLFFALICLLAVVFMGRPGEVIHADGEISGTVFRDFDSDGVQDINEPGIAGVIVTAYSDSVPQDVQTDTTASDGSYTVPFTTGNNARVEFTLPLDGSLDFLQPSAAGNTTVQFVDISLGNVGNVDVGFINPAQYVVDAPQVMISRFQRGNQAASSEAVILGHDYNADGVAAPKYEYAAADEVGTIYGLAYQPSSDVLFGSSYIRRGSGLGPEDETGTIYQLTGSGAPSLFINATATVNTGANPHPNLTTNFITDTLGYAAVGKVGFGDLEISDDEMTLYAVNLFERELVVLPMTFDAGGQPQPPAVGNIVQVPIPAPAPCDGSVVGGPTSADWRPFALKYFDDTLYVGGVCSAESMITTLGLDPGSSTFADLAPIRPFIDAFVLEFDPATNTFNPAPILQIDMDYAREQINSGMAAFNDGEWLPWTDEWRPNWAAGPTATNLMGNPQPILADIEFDGRGFMFLGFRDRFADQAYHDGDPGPVVPSAGFTGQRFGGDLLLACQDAGGTWSLEAGSPSSCTSFLETRTATNPPSLDSGTSLDEFFHEEQYQENGNPATPRFHDETALGALAVLYGSGEMVATKYDTFYTFEGGTTTFDTANGDRLRAVQVYPDDNQVNSFGKAGGLGDIELLGAAAPIEIGNRVWVDADADGIQDAAAAEVGINGVTVELYDDTNTLIASTVTANIGGQDGYYYFSNRQNFGTVVSKVILSSDDADQRTDTGVMNLTRGQLNLGNNSNPVEPLAVGLRFQNLAIPANATITSAYIQFTTDNGTPSNINDPATLRIRAQEIASAPTFTAAANDITTRTTTSSFVDWSTPTWTGSRFSTPDQRTADLSTLVQEVLNDTAWASGNAMAFIIESSADHRNGESFNAVNGSAAPILVVNYTQPDPANYADLQYRSDYEVRIDVSQLALASRGMSPANAPQPANNGAAATDNHPVTDVADSDASLTGTTAVIAFSTGGPGSNNHGLDFGFTVSDWGDLPDSFDTTAGNSGATHAINGNLFLGDCVDSELDGQPDATAGSAGAGSGNGDDGNTGTSTLGTCAAGGADEDGVQMVTPLIPGAEACVSVTAVNNTGGDANLYGFIDYDGDGQYDADVDDLLTGGTNGIPFTGGVAPVADNGGAGATNTYCFDVPAGATFDGGETHLRFRLTTDTIAIDIAGGDTPWAGGASDGEVEDYYTQLTCVGNYMWFDTGTTPDVQDGGDTPVPDTAVDLVWEGPDGIFGTGDDVTYSTTTSGGIYQFCGLLPDANGIGGADQYQIIVPNSPGTPVTPNQGGDVALDSDGTPNGNASEGPIFTLPTANMTNDTAPNDVDPNNFPDDQTDLSFDFGFMGSFDWGDLPDTGPGTGSGDYNTLGSDNGPVHVMVDGTFLGACVDGETDGQPDTEAGMDGIGGDDGNTGAPVTGTCAVAGDDEDGMTITDPLLGGSGLAICTSVTINVTGVVPPAGSGTLNAWIDWNGDGDFNDTVDGVPEQIVTDNNVPASVTGGPADVLAFIAGASTLESFSMVIPCEASISGSYAGMRLRFSSDTGLTPTGTAGNGEIEDYRLSIYGWDFADAPDNDSTYPANQTVMVDATNYSHGNPNEGARHLLTDGLHLGSCVDAETDGVPVAAGSPPDGDDTAVGTVTAGTCIGNDDEDGLSGFVSLDPNWADGGSVEVDVSGVSGQACVYGWVDWGADGFGVGSDSTANVTANADSTVTLFFPDDANMPPSGGFPGTAYLRLRVVPGACGVISAIGLINGGEVEDHQLSFEPTAVTLTDLTAASQSPSTTVMAGVLLLIILSGFVVFWQKQRRRA